MSRHGFFITGTDTGVGKTWIAAGLMSALRARNYRVAGMKPVSCGVIETELGPLNEDVVLLQQHGLDPAPPHTLINRYAFDAAIAPHLAAEMNGVTIETDVVLQDLKVLAGLADMIIIEGAGGWEVPINDRQTMAEIARACGLPVILVVGIRLGCLNHALLSSRAIVASGIEFAGWIANTIDPDMPFINDNIKSLRRRLPAPLLGVVPPLEEFDTAVIASSLDLGILLKG